MKYFLNIILVVVEILFLSHTTRSQDHDSRTDANEYMNRADFNRLVNSFESESRIEEQKPDDVIALFGDLTGKTVIDIGAGTGLFSFKMAEKAEKVIAADVDDRFLEFVKFRLDTLSNGSLKTKIESRKIPYDDPGLKRYEVDGVLLVNTYHHIENRVEYLKKLKNGIRDGGRILIIDFFKNSNYGPPNNHKLAMDIVIAELKEAGYSNIQTDIHTLAQQYIVIVDINR